MIFIESGREILLCYLVLDLVVTLIACYVLHKICPKIERTSTAHHSPPCPSGNAEGGDGWEGKNTLTGVLPDAPYSEK